MTRPPTRPLSAVDAPSPPDGAGVSALDALTRALETSRAGGSAAIVVAASGTPAGRRLVLLRPADGGEEVWGSLGEAAYDDAALELARGEEKEGLHTLAPEGETPLEVFLELRRPLPGLVIVGAGHIARPLSRMGALLGFSVTVVDDRPDFATRERFPDADRVVKVDFDDPFASIPIHAASHLLLVTRGHRYDYQCLVDLLRRPRRPAYIGMIGSRRRVRATFAQLLDDGIPRAHLDTIHAPVGLDVGAETPEEIAVAVAAELVLHRRGGSGRPLRDVARVAERFFSPSPAGEES